MRAARQVQPGRALAVLCVAVLMVNLDNTILNVALPTLVRKLGATTGQLQWIVDSYAIVFGGVLLVGGSVADRFGRRLVFLAGLLTFGGGSAAAAFSGRVDPLIAWRAVMGLGAAMTIPAGLSIVNDIFRAPRARARAVGAWSGTVGLGIAIGPVAGGLLLSRFWWGSVFLVNVPVVAAGIVGTILLVPNSRAETTRSPDPAGAVLSVAGLGLVLWSIIEAPTVGWGSAEVIATALGGLLVIVGFVTWERASQHPMLPLAYFRERRFSIAAASLGVAVFTLLGGLFVLTQFLQFDLGYSPLGAGVRVLPISGVLALGALASHRVVDLAGTKLTASGALALVAIGVAEIAAVGTTNATYLDELPGMLLMGLGAGLLLPAGTESVLGAVARDDSGVGSATNSTAMQVGGALGVAVIGSILSTRYQHHMHGVLTGRTVPSAARRAILGSIGGALAVAKAVPGVLGQALALAARTGFMSGNRSALSVAAIVTGAGALLVLAWLPSRPT
ncbi:MAG TPA: MFS transporter [Acidimicrobiales bacterium]|nr:MFS transporter [Acidimicrobiales bacterium]